MQMTLLGHANWLELGFGRHISEIFTETIGLFYRELGIRPCIDDCYIDGCYLIRYIVYDKIKVGTVKIIRNVDGKSVIECEGYKVVNGKPQSVLVTGQ